MDGYEVGFDVGKYDPRHELVIDPQVLLYCGYIGGAQNECAYDIVVDSSGNAYVAGETQSDHSSFPVAVGPDTTYNGGWDAFVAKVKADGSGLLYCGYIGGSQDEYARGISVDTSGNAYVAGRTQSDENSFPVKDGPDTTHNGNWDGFVAKVSADGTNLLYCGYIGGAQYDYTYSITVDTSGNAYVAGETQSDHSSFPVAVGPDTTYNGGWDAFVAKVKADGSGLIYCGYIGGSQDDYAWGISVDSSGNAYVAGYTNSTEGQNFPVTVGPDLTYNGNYWDVFVARVGPSTSHVLRVISGDTSRGTVRSTPGGIDCGDTCSNYFPDGSSVVLSAEPADGWAFDGWEGQDCPGNGPCTLLMDQDREVTALFSQDSDGDGVSDQIEDGGPNNGDGDMNGTLDKFESHVATYKSIYGDYVTLVIPAIYTFSDVRFMDDPSGGDAPGGRNFGVGFVGFKVNGVGRGGSVVVKMILHRAMTVVNYYKYGRTAENGTDHWYEFWYTDADGLGAKTGVDGYGRTYIDLYLRDGAKGDDDLADDGTITDAGGPATVSPSGAGSDTGCIIELLQ
jgi:hypothetical protein